MLSLKFTLTDKPADTVDDAVGRCHIRIKRELLNNVARAQQLPPIDLAGLPLVGGVEKCPRHWEVTRQKLDVEYLVRAGGLLAQPLAEAPGIRAAGGVVEDLLVEAESFLSEETQRGVPLIGRDFRLVRNFCLLMTSRSAAHLVDCGSPVLQSFR